MATRFAYTILDRKTGISTGRFRNMKLARQAVSKMPKGCYSIILRGATQSFSRPGRCDMTTESKKLQTFTKGDIRIHAAKFPAPRIEALRFQNAQDNGLDRDTCVDLLTQAEIAHEQREVIRQMYVSLRHSSSCAWNYEESCNCGCDEAAAAAAPYIQD